MIKKDQTTVSWGSLTLPSYIILSFMHKNQNVIHLITHGLKTHLHFSAPIRTKSFGIRSKAKPCVSGDDCFIKLKSRAKRRIICLSLLSSGLRCTRLFASTHVLLVCVHINNSSKSSWKWNIWFLTVVPAVSAESDIVKFSRVWAQILG